MKKLLFLGLISLNTATAATVANGDFETDSASFTEWPGYVGAAGNLAEIPGWTGDGGRGLNPVEPRGAADAPFDDPSSFNTTTFAFLQGDSYIEQTMTGFSAGMDYLLELDFNSRGCCGDVPIATISIDGEVTAGSVDFFGDPGAIPTAVDPDPWYHAEIPFTAAGTEVVVRIATAPSAGGDATLVVDNVTVSPAEVIPEPSSAVLGLLGLGFLLGRRRR